MKVFISYSHKDENVVERLHTHMATLKREGLVQAWYDRDIAAGSNLDDEISRELETSELVLLIVSPDFIASDYCFNIELSRAREKQKNGEQRIVPVIAEPCDWHSVLGDLKAVPKDGKAISDWRSENTALLDVVQEIRRIIEKSPRKSDVIFSAPKTPSNAPQKYRVKKEFDDIDKAEFIENSFVEIRRFFEEASLEIEALDGIRSKFTVMSESEFQCILVNKNVSNGRAFISVRRKASGRSYFNDIDFSTSENSSLNSSNGGFSVKADDFELAWVGRLSLSASDKRMSAIEVAEHLWTEFVSQAGIQNA